MNYRRQICRYSSTFNY